MKKPAQTIVVQDVIATELHDPARAAAIVSSPGKDETTRIGFATSDLGMFIVQLMRLNATAMAHQSKLPGGPTLDQAPRLELQDAQVTRTSDGAQVALVLWCSGGIQIPLTFPPDTATRFAALLEKHARGEPSDPLH